MTLPSTVRQLVGAFACCILMTSCASPSDTGSGNLGASPPQEIGGDAPVYSSWEEVVNDSKAVVVGTVTEARGTVPSKEGITYSVFTLTVDDPLGFDAPSKVTVVDFDRSKYTFETDIQPAIDVGMTGVFALNTADRKGILVFPDLGPTSWVVRYLRADGDVYRDSMGKIPPLDSLADVEASVREQVKR
ncbi:hypothetical protein KMZ32_10145 [Phycicoccus sp. MAQZ13P-2]|uniref:hypothetical protein n=1 Tax=Phycicoccus mangrovi TaxID=2840470 RepID=UPI001BFFFB3D|nr:hypothetical protein [Phycicoccus mangrovi]MBT9255835.1 hypothetical protein [Phycicoccus mangrovi]MBT9274429.1 hypothetical protein [Phycicoccus mangrovi]